MNIFERARHGFDFILRGQKATTNIVPTWQMGSPVYSAVKFENMVKSGFRKNELIFACVGVTAKTASQVALKFQNRGGDELGEEHPLVTLMKRPNPRMDEYDFWSAVHIFQALGGRAIFEKQRSAAGAVVGLWPLRPDYIEPIPGPNNTFKAYKFTVPGNVSVFLDPEDIVDFKLFDPIDQFNAYPPAAVAARVGDIDNSQTDYIKLFFDEGGMPPGVISVPGAVNERRDDAGRLRRQWAARYGGFANWTKGPAVLEKGAEYNKIGFDFREMGMDYIDRRSEVKICQVFDVPPIIVGTWAGLERSTMANYQETRKHWWEDVLIPKYKSQRDVISTQLVKDFDANIKPVWDFSGVPALTEDQDKIWTRANSAMTAGYVTVNEAREMVGLERVGDGDVFLRGLGMSEIGAEVESGGKIRLNGRKPKRLTDGKAILEEGRELPPYPADGEYLNLDEAVSVWNELMPGYEGLLEAEVE